MRWRVLTARRSVFVDAQPGAVLEAQEQVHKLHGAAEHAAAGSGNGHYNGPVSIDTSQSGGQYSMTDPTRTGLKCGYYPTKQVYTGPDDNWGNGQAIDFESACVDTLFAAQKEWDMLREWLGRSGVNGNGKSFPAYVGLGQVNAYWDGQHHDLRKLRGQAARGDRGGCGGARVRPDPRPGIGTGQELRRSSSLSTGVSTYDSGAQVWGSRTRTM